MCPAGEWLCWPCREHEEAELRAGRSQHQIRPPRWEAVDHRRHLEGGSLAAECALCPVRCGAFRRTVDTGDWVHQVCTLPLLRVGESIGSGWGRLRESSAPRNIWHGPSESLLGNPVR